MLYHLTRIREQIERCHENLLFFFRKPDKKCFFIKGKFAIELRFKVNVVIEVIRNTYSSALHCEE